MRHRTDPAPQNPGSVVHLWRKTSTNGNLTDHGYRSSTRGSLDEIALALKFDNLRILDESLPPHTYAHLIEAIRHLSSSRVAVRQPFHFRRVHSEPPAYSWDMNHPERKRFPFTILLNSGGANRRKVTLIMRSCKEFAPRQPRSFPRVSNSAQPPFSLKHMIQTEKGQQKYLPSANEQQSERQTKGRPGIGETRPARRL